MPHLGESALFGENEASLGQNLRDALRISFQTVHVILDILDNRGQLNKLL